MIRSLSNLKEVSLRIKYKKDWDQDTESACVEAIEEYKEQLASETWLSQNNEKINQKKQLIVFIIGWPIIIIIIILSEATILLDYYQRKK